MQEQGPYNVRTETIYEYEPKYALPVKTVTTAADNSITESFIKYSFQYDILTGNTSAQASALNYYNNNNIIVPVEQYVKKNGKVINAEFNTYCHNAAFRNLNASSENYVPNKKYQFFSKEIIDNYEESYFEEHTGNLILDPHMEEVESYDSYDEYNRVLTVSTPSEVIYIR